MARDFDPRRELDVVIMAGGSGTRFWPLSTEERPKQFLRLFGARSMLQLTWDRIATLVPEERVFVLTNARYLPLVREQLPQLPADNVIGEPMARDTSGAIALATAVCRARHGDPVMAVLTADHLIQPVEVFQSTLVSAAEAAKASGALYTFGVVPSFPATGYGYLEAGESLGVSGGVEHFILDGFREKPDLDTARAFLKARRYSWNSGMFVWRTSAIEAALRRHLPTHGAIIAPLAEADRTPGWNEAMVEAFEPLPKISIDFGVMEKAERVRMIRATFEWSDVGDWLALERFHEPDGDGNRGSAKIHALGANNNAVFCDAEGEAIALVGVRDLIVVRAGNRTLVAHRTATEQVKQLVERLREDGEF